MAQNNKISLAQMLILIKLIIKTINNLVFAIKATKQYLSLAHNLSL